LGFERLVTLDIILYGASLILEFVTLVVLRIREPDLKREFRVPGGMAGAVLVGVFPLLLLGLAVVRGGSETVLGINGVVFGMVIIAAGFVVYLATAKLRRRALRPRIVERVEAA
jgi:amino acid transporter